MDRLKALALNIQTLIASGGAILLAPIMAIGLSKKRKTNIARMAFVMLISILAAMSLVFPYAGEIIQQHMNWRKQMNDMMENREYSLITRVDGNDLTFTEEALTGQYEKLCTLPLCIG